MKAKNDFITTKGYHPKFLYISKVDLITLVKEMTGQDYRAEYLPVKVTTIFGLKIIQQPTIIFYLT